MTSTRYVVVPRLLVWVDRFDGSRTPGIGLYRGRTVVAHATPSEAREMADLLHDMADQLEARTPTPTTESEK